jgi:hypothetical protein
MILATAAREREANLEVERQPPLTSQTKDREPRAALYALVRLMARLAARELASPTGANQTIPIEGGPDDRTRRG